VVAAIRNRWLDACNVLHGEQISSYEAALEALYSLEDMEPGSTGDAIAQLEDIGYRFEFRNAVVAYSMQLCPLILEAFLDWDDLYQAISDAQIDDEEVRQGLYDKGNNAEAAFNIGSLKESGNILCALLNQVSAQDGKHIDAASAEAIRNMTISMAGQLGIPLDCSS
jgi:hypothetical protein